MPDSGGELTFAEKIKTIQTSAGRTRPRRRETRDDDGRIVRTVTAPTDSGAVTTVTNRSSRRGEHQDVRVQAPPAIEGSRT